MAGQGFILSESDVAILKGIVDREKRGWLNTRGRPDPDEPGDPTPDKYMLLTTSTITGMVEDINFGTATGSGTSLVPGEKNTPGQGTGQVYQIKLSKQLNKLNQRIPDMVQVGRQTELVYNASPDSIPADSWVPASRDKFGSWWVEGYAPPQVTYGMVVSGCNIYLLETSTGETSVASIISAASICACCGHPGTATVGTSTLVPAQCGNCASYPKTICLTWSVTFTLLAGGTRTFTGQSTLTFDSTFPLPTLAWFGPVVGGLQWNLSCIQNGFRAGSTCQGVNTSIGCPVTDYACHPFSGSGFEVSSGGFSGACFPGVSPDGVSEWALTVALTDGACGGITGTGSHTCSLSRTSLGQVSSSSSSTLTIPNVTLATGALLIANVAWNTNTSEVTSVVWGPLTLTIAGSLENVGGAFPGSLAMYHGKAAASGTHSLVVTFSSPHVCLLNAVEVQGLPSASLDFVTNGRGTTVGPDTGAIGVNASSCEYVEAAFLMVGESGSWSYQGGFTDGGQQVDQGAFVLTEGDRFPVAKTTTVDASLTGTTQTGWAAIGASFS